jgi:hypothetical protein
MDRKEKTREMRSAIRRNHNASRTHGGLIDEYFVVDGPRYRVRAGVGGWRRVFAWFDKYLNSPTH